MMHLSSQLVQKDRFIDSFRDLSLCSKANEWSGMRSAVSVNSNSRANVWQNPEDSFYYKTVTMPPNKNVYRSYPIQEDYCYEDKPSEDPSGGKSYVNRLRQANATVWCEYGVQPSGNVKIRKNKNNYGAKTGFSIKSLVFSHAPVILSGRPMAHYARSTNNAAPQHTMLIPRLSATETCPDGDHGETPVYSSALLNNSHYVEKTLHDIPEIQDNRDASEDASTSSSSSGSPYLQPSIRSFTASSHYSHNRFPSSYARSPSKNSIFSKNYNECTDNTLNTSPASQHIHPQYNQHYLYSRNHNVSGFSVNQDLYQTDPNRKLYIANLAKNDIVSDDDI
ncbi:hypothetical protein PORY_001087 [Pneumocystis oryctolagi]|uniref:Uncharacterized protein n=1 Tax=Pneumocystis oryctolagi TaxID=42067 RepID=A0ACB7CD94_9ASCO|nr:hypothetical protein PORY_001087 [Pneumocystis oryctolagi]